MDEFIILDSYGARHATIKAETKKEALTEYLKRTPTKHECLAFNVIYKSVKDRFKRNVKFI